MVRAIWYQAKTHKLIIVAGFLLAAVVFSHATATVNAATTCPTDTSRGEVTGSFTLTAASTQSYRVYSRMTAPSATSNTYVLEVDGTCYNVGGSSVPQYTSSNSNWDSGSADWIDAEATAAGATGTTPIDISLAPGSHSYTMIGNADNVRVDRVIFTQENGTGTCVPKGVGDNCANDVAPTVSITSPANNAQVSGTVTVSATADDSNGAGTVSKVELDVNGAAQPTDMTHTSGTTYTYSLDTTKLADGAYTLAAKAYDPGTNVGTSANVAITVKNATSPVCTNPASVGAPTGLSVVPNTANSGTVSKYTALNLSWSAGTPSSGCTISGYNIYRDGSTTALNGGTLVTSTTYTDSGFTANTSHSYTVQAVDSGANKSAKTTAVVGTTAADNVAPNIPTNLAATAAGAGQINLSWTASTDNPSPGGVGVASYNVYRSTGSSTTFAKIGNSTTATYNDTTVSSSTKYNYEVSAVDNAANESALTTSASATTAAPTCSANPSVPTAFHSTAQTATSIGLAWTASTASAGCTIAGYHIFRADVSTTTPLATVTSGTSYTDPSGGAANLTPFTSYTYTITAFDTSGHSSASAPTSPATIATLKDTTAPSAPGTVTATAVSSTQVNLSWTASTDNIGVASYAIFRNGSTTALATVNGTTLTYSDTTASPSTSYTYQVVAFDGAANKSAATTSNQVTTQAPPADVTPPSAPGTPSAPVVAAQTAQITWPASTDPGGSGIAGYRVYLKLSGVDVLDGTTSTTSFTDQCLEPGVSYTYDIKAFDTAGNVSGTASKTITTPSANVFQGDVNCNQAVDFPDLLKEVVNWQKAGMLPSQGDVTGEGTVNFNDLLKTTVNWGKTW